MFILDIGDKRWSDNSERKQYTNNPTYLNQNTDGKNGGWAGITVVTE